MAKATHGPAFMSFKNSVFGTPEGMAVAAPMATNGIPRNLFLHDTFMKRVIPHRGLWPEASLGGGRTINTYDDHKRAVDLLRADLSRAPSTDPVAPDEPNNIPRWRIDLLDEAMRKVFYSDPPIPFETERQDAKGDAFEISLTWHMDANTNLPIKLDLIIYCPTTITP